jgi:hypothetical protein
MRVSALVLASAVATQAFEFSDVTQSLKRGLSSLSARKDGGSGKCDPVWSTISKALVRKFSL